MARGEPIYYKGIRLTEYCKNNGLNYNKVYSRIWREIPIEEAVQYKLKHDGRKNNGGGRVKNAIKYKGMTLRKFCETHIYKCYSYPAALYRYKSGMTIERALFGNKYKGKVI